MVAFNGKQPAAGEPTNTAVAYTFCPDQVITPAPGIFYEQPISAC